MIEEASIIVSKEANNFKTMYGTKPNLKTFQLGEDDDDSFFPTSSTQGNLASLFTNQEGIKKDEEPTPKVSTDTPKVSTVKSETVKPQSRVVVAKSVTVLRCHYPMDKVYKSLGRFGLALIEINGMNGSQNSIVSYTNKRQYLFNVPLTEELVISCEKDESLLLSLDTKRHWLLKFDNNSDYLNFKDELSKKSAKIIDTNKNEIDNETKTIPTSKNDQEKSLPNDAALENTTKTNKTSDNTNLENRKFDEADDGLKNNASIISRMKKIGQPLLLPNSAAMKDNIKEDIDLNLNKLSNNITQPNKETCDKNGENINNRETIISNCDNLETIPSSSNDLNRKSLLNSSNFINPNSNIMAYPQNIFMTQPYQNSSEFSMFLSESRANNSEIRMHLMQLENRLDNVLNKNQMSMVISPNEGTVIDKVTSLQTQITSLERNNVTLQTLLQNSEQKTKQLESELNALKNDNVKFIREIHHCMTEIKNSRVDTENNQNSITFPEKLESTDQFSDVESMQNRLIEMFRKSFNEKISKEFLITNEKDCEDFKLKTQGVIEKSSDFSSFHEGLFSEHCDLFSKFLSVNQQLKLTAGDKRNCETKEQLNTEPETLEYSKKELYNHDTIIEEKNTIISELENTITALRNELEDRRKMTADIADKQVTELEEKLNTQSENLNSIKKELQDHQTTIEEKSEVIMELTNTITELRNESLSQMNLYKSHVEEVMETVYDGILNVLAKYDDESLRKKQIARVLIGAANAMKNNLN